MLDERFVILGAAISFLGNFAYIIATLKGTVKPNRVTWFIWSIAPFTAAAAELSQGIGLMALMTFMAGFNPFLIFLASFVNKKAYWKLSHFDLACGGFALVGLVLWAITETPNLAILFAIFAEVLAAIPTFVKSYKVPQTELPWGFLGGSINAAIALLTIQVWNFEHFAFPLYIFLVSGSLFLLISVRRKGLT